MTLHTDKPFATRIRAAIGSAPRDTVPIAQALGLCAIFSLVAGCTDGGSANPVATASQTAAPPLDDGAPAPRFSNTEIAGKVYARNVTVPDTFYRDPSQVLATSFTLRHLRANDVGEPGNHEVCSNDLSAAIAWSQAAASQWPVLTVTQTDAYVEITHQRTDLTDWIALQRVFRCDFLQRDTAAPGASTGSAGRLAAAQASAESLRFVAEYLWQFSTYSNPGSAVLASQPQSVDQGWRHTLHLAKVSKGAGEALGCDRIDRMNWHYDLSPAGALTQHLEAVRSFDARAFDGTWALCPSN